MSLIGFERWKVKNPNGTEGQFLIARKAVLQKAGNALLPPKTATLPDGVIVSVGEISATEIGSINKEFIQNSAHHQ